MNVILWLLLAGVAAAFIQMFLTAQHKKKYNAALKSGAAKSICIELGRKYYKSMSKPQRKKNGIMDIETRIINDLQQYNIQ